MSCTLLLVWALWVPDAAGSGRHKASGHYAGKALPVVIEEAPRSVQKGRNDVEYKDPQFHCCSSSPRPGATEVEEVEYSAMACSKWGGSSVKNWLLVLPRSFLLGRKAEMRRGLHWLCTQSWHWHVSCGLHLMDNCWVQGLNIQPVLTGYCWICHYVPHWEQRYTHTHTQIDRSVKEEFYVKLDSFIPGAERMTWKWFIAIF